MKHALSAWKLYSAKSGFIPAWDSFTSRWTWILSFITRRQRTDRFWRKGLLRRGSYHLSSREGIRIVTHGSIPTRFFFYYPSFGSRAFEALSWAARASQCAG